MKRIKKNSKIRLQKFIFFFDKFKSFFQIYDRLTEFYIFF